MTFPGRDRHQAILESLCARLKMGVALVDGGGRTLLARGFGGDEFPGLFEPGAQFEEVLGRIACLEADRAHPSTLDPSLADADVRRVLRAGSPTAVYRHFRLALECAGPGHVLHCFVDISHEKKLEEHFLLNLHQLKSMKEIVDILYESLSTPEVVYLCLVAVTAQMGFGFNRAFFLQVNGKRMRGRIGIGPSDSDEANQIWTHLAARNFSSLREVYQDLTRNGGVPDLRTQEIALRLEFDLGALHSSRDVAAAVPGALPGLLGVLERGKPAKLDASDAGSEVDRMLFRLLGTDSVAIVPLFVRGSLAGVIIADNLITRKPIREGDLNVLKTFAGYAGVALERSHLYDELKESVAKLQAANETLKTSQQKLLQAEKLSAIGELAAHVTHEIRNPLVAIGGLARSLLCDERHDPETHETLQIIVSEVRRLEKFLRETLDFVKPRVVGAVLLDLKTLVLDCLATFRNELSASAIELETVFQIEAVRSFIDPDLLRHSLSNLVKNAIEAMKGGGKLRVEVFRNGVSATIRVCDTGPGIPPEARPRIFDPFFTTKPEGTGLGLAIALQSIRGLGGRLELENDDVYRTVFKMTLPLPNEEGAQGPRGSEETFVQRMAATTSRSMS